MNWNLINLLKLKLLVLFLLCSEVGFAQNERHLQRGKFYPKTSFEYPNKSSEGFELDYHPIKCIEVKEDGFTIFQHNLLIPALFKKFIKTEKSTIKSGFEYSWNWDANNSVTIVFKYSPEKNSYIPKTMYIKKTDPSDSDLYNPNVKSPKSRYFKILF